VFYLKFCACLSLLALPLCAQQLPLDEHQLGSYKGQDTAIRSAMDYCNGLDSFLQDEQPRIFAELNPGAATKSETSHWTEFASKDEWETSGKPSPVAFVWKKDEAIVRVTVVSRAQAGLRRRVDYCYGADNKLVRIRALPFAPTECEALFPCRLILNREFYVGGRHPVITDWVFTADGAIEKLLNGRLVDDYFDPSNSLTADDLHLPASNELPFK